MKKQGIFVLFGVFILLFTQCNTPQTATVSTQSSSNNFERWQQRVEYTMDVDFDHTNHQYLGTQKLDYFNNSPDELNKVFFHFLCLKLYSGAPGRLKQASH